MRSRSEPPPGLISLAKLMSHNPGLEPERGQSCWLDPDGKPALLLAGLTRTAVVQLPGAAPRLVLQQLVQVAPDLVLVKAALRSVPWLTSRGASRRGAAATKAQKAGTMPTTRAPRTTSR